MPSGRGSRGAAIGSVSEKRSRRESARSAKAGRLLRNEPDFWRSIRPGPYRRLKVCRANSVPPEQRLIPAKPVHDLVIKIGQAQEANRDVARCIRCAGSAALRVKLMLTICAGDNILAKFGAGTGQGLGSPLPG